jgi:hypothetical protein
VLSRQVEVWDFFEKLLFTFTLRSVANFTKMSLAILMGFFKKKMDAGINKKN